MASLQYSPGPPFGAAEYRRRLEGLWHRLEAEGIAVAVLMYAADLVYFTGLGLHAQLVVVPGREPVLLVQVNPDRARVQGWVKDVRASIGLKTLREVVAELAPTGAVGLPLDIMPVTAFQRLQATLGAREYRDLSPTVLALRSIKSEAELEVMRRAAAISAAGFGEGRRWARPGVPELELQRRMEDVEKAQGADGYNRARSATGSLPWGTVCSGPNTAEISGYWMTMTGVGTSAAQPYAAATRVLSEGDLVVIDRCVALHGYMVDEARTFAVGRPDPAQVQQWAALGRILDATLAAVRPGASIAGVYGAARAQAEAEGLLKNFMTFAVYNVEYVGHGVGIEMDEPPLVSPRTPGDLKPGMVLALEPKVIIPGSFGLTLEDTVAVTPDGVEVLTRTPREWFAL